MEDLDRRRFLRSLVGVSLLGVGAVGLAPDQANAANSTKRPAKKAAKAKKKAEYVEIVTLIDVQEAATLRSLDSKAQITGSVTKSFVGSLRTLALVRPNAGDWPFEELRSTVNNPARILSGLATTSGTYRLLSAPGSNPDVTQNVQWENSTAKVQISHYQPVPSVFGTGFDAIGRYVAETKPINSTLSSNGASVQVALNSLAPLPISLSSFGDPGSSIVYRNPPDSRPAASTTAPLAPQTFDAIEVMRSGVLVANPIFWGVQISFDVNGYPSVSLTGSHTGRSAQPDLDMTKTVSMSISTTVTRTTKQRL
jgi:hypothetical protein